MESIGEKLKNTREEKGYTIEQISRETNIARRYIEALETEDFSIFPGDPYLIGFLRNYSEHLGLNPSEIVSLYKNFKVQEMPPPPELLNPAKKRPQLLPLLIGFFVLVILVAAAVFIIPSILDRPEKEVAETPEAPESTPSAGQARIFPFDDEILEQLFPQGSGIEVVLDNKTFIIRFKEIGDAIELSYDGTTTTVALGEERLLDLDADGEDDIKVFIRDIEIDNDTAGAVARFDKFTDASVAETVDQESQGAADLLKPLSEKEELSFGSTSEPSRRKEPFPIITESEPQAFRFQVDFNGPCLILYQLDGEERESSYFGSGERLRLNVTRGVHLWISDAGALRVVIAGEPVELGRPGEVVSWRIQWVESAKQDSYRLVAIPAY